MAYDYSGSGQYHSLASAVLTGVPITMACWFNPDSATTAATMISLGSTSSNDFFKLGINASSNVLAQTQQTASPAQAVSSTTCSAGVWQHAAAYFGLINSRAAYLNGGGKGTDSTSKTPVSINRTAVGTRLTSTSTTLFAGLLAEAAIWNGGLDDNEIAHLASGISPLKVRPDLLVFYAPLLGSGLELIAGTALTATGSPAVVDHPPQVYMPRRSIIGQRPGPTKAQVAATESTDTGSVTTSVTTGASVAATESTDTTALATTVTTGASLVSTESTDTAAVTAANWTTAQAAAAESGDTAAITAAATASASVVATESSDTAAITTAITTGASVAATETGDTASVTAEVTTGASLGATEASDTAVITGAVPTAAGIVATETSDSTVISAESWSAAYVGATESADTASISATVTTGAEIASSEATDTANIIVVIWTPQEDGSATWTPANASGLWTPIDDPSGSWIPNSATGLWTEIPDPTSAWE